MLTLVDTSVWIDHLHGPEPRMMTLLADGLVITHPMMIGELAVGSLRRRREVLESLHELPGAPVAEFADVLDLIEVRALHGRGIAYVDAHLLASTLITPGARLWSRDRRLAAVAAELGIAA